MGRQEVHICDFCWTCIHGATGHHLGTALFAPRFGIILLARLIYCLQILSAELWQMCDVQKLGENGPIFVVTSLNLALIHSLYLSFFK